MEKSVTKSDIIWNYLGIFVNLGSNFVLIPFIVKYLDGDNYGLWTIFLSLGSIVTLFDFGFNPTFARNIAYCWSGAKKLLTEKVAENENGAPNFVLMAKVMKTCRIIYFLLSMFALIILGTCGTVYIVKISASIPGKAHIYAWLIFLGYIFLNLLFGYYAAFLRGVGAIADLNKITILSKIIQMVLAVFLLYIGWGILGVSIAYCTYGILFRLLGKHAFYTYRDIGKNLNLVHDEVHKEEIRQIFKTIWHNSWRDGIVSLALYLSNQAGTVIGSLSLTLTETGAYSLAMQLGTGIANIASSLFYTYIPSLQAARVKQDRNYERRKMSEAISSYVCLYILGMMALIIIGLPLLKILKPSAVVNLPAIILIGIYQFVLQYCICYTSYIASGNQIPYMKAYVISAACGAILSLVFTKIVPCGIPGLVLPPLIIQLSYNFWHWSGTVHKELKLNSVEIAELALKEFQSAFHKKNN